MWSCSHCHYLRAEQQSGETDSLSKEVLAKAALCWLQVVVQHNILEHKYQMLENLYFILDTQAPVRLKGREVNHSLTVTV